MRLSKSDVASIKACKDLYSQRATARHFNVTPKTVRRVWQEEAYEDIAPGEAPNIDQRPALSLLAEDVRLLIDRGLSRTEVADHLSISRTTVWRITSGRGCMS